MWGYPGTYERSRSCTHGLQCNFLHCFRNPGSAYSYADHDMSDSQRSHRERSRCAWRCALKMTERCLSTMQFWWFPIAFLFVRASPWAHGLKTCPSSSKLTCRPHADLSIVCIPRDNNVEARRSSQQLEVDKVSNCHKTGGRYSNSLRRQDIRSHSRNSLSPERLHRSTHKPRERHRRRSRSRDRRAESRDRRVTQKGQPRDEWQRRQQHKHERLVSSPDRYFAAEADGILQEFDISRGRWGDNDV